MAYKSNPEATYSTRMGLFDDVGFPRFPMQNILCGDRDFIW